jgi:hypothetical protein
MKKWKNNRNSIINIFFVLSCVAILIVLLNAPKETTVKLPNNMLHARFHVIKNKKEAEKFCGDCHFPQGQAPLPKNHPNKSRCLLCHKIK